MESPITLTQPPHALTIQSFNLTIKDSFKSRILKAQHTTAWALNKKVSPNLQTQSAHLPFLTFLLLLFYIVVSHVNMEPNCILLMQC